MRIYATSSDPTLQQELQLKLARKCLHACGISLFDLEKDLHIISESLRWASRGTLMCGDIGVRGRGDYWYTRVPKV